MAPKNFFYISLGIFLLVAAWTMGAQHARADWDSNEFPILGFTSNKDASGVVTRAVRTDGTLWGIAGDGSWVTVDVDPPLPIPLNQIAFLDWPFVISTSGAAWMEVGNSWVQQGQIPSPTVSVEFSTWSGVKEGFRRD